MSKGSQQRLGAGYAEGYDRIFAKPDKPSAVADKCRHDWPQGERGVDMQSCCTKCGITFMRYILTECP